ncbi:MAG: hypothetical protein H0X62_04130 [Bacteroidetes bacterium]|nr:hypothetical protein [Bacteroidota bacterium]
MSKENKNSADNTGAVNPEIEALKKTISEQEELIVELQAELEKSETTKGGSVPVFELDGKKYQVVIPSFKQKGEKYTAKDVLENKELQAQLVGSGSGVVSLLN